jgi:hypothetical protein
MENNNKAKCTHCGDEMEVETSVNWSLYCKKEECRKAFMEQVIQNTQSRRKRKKG